MPCLAEAAPERASQTSCPSCMPLRQEKARSRIRLTNLTRPTIAGCERSDPRGLVLCIPVHLALREQWGQSLARLDHCHGET
mmetsp:Transcript_135828/g.247657  ORF Transcript_135828/g.247657 Transcript_135828/m.247657 type:complete len:82 (-) Transcript_135828:820-1065(-)